MSLDISKFNFQQLKGDISVQVSAALEGLVTGAKGDILAFGVAITEDFLEAKLTGREDIVEQLFDQLKALAEVHRIRVVNETWALVASVLKAIFSAVLATALAAL